MKASAGFGRIIEAGNKKAREQVDEFTREPLIGRSKTRQPAFYSFIALWPGQHSCACAVSVSASSIP